jgi:hypothetical protein
MEVLLIGIWFLVVLASFNAIVTRWSGRGAYAGLALGVVYLVAMGWLVISFELLWAGVVPFATVALLNPDN